MNLALFDIDGTLAFGAEVLDPIFTEVLCEVAAVAGIDTDWNNYAHVTDQGIVAHTLTASLGRVDPALVARVHDAYVARMPPHLEAVREVPGARDALAHLDGEPRWAIAIATGNWLRPAQLKLAAAGIDPEAYPVVGCDAHASRAGLMAHAVRTAAAHHGHRFERVVYLGDGTWDVHACRALDMPLVGIGPADGPLAGLGVSHILPDLRAKDALMAALAAATTPDAGRQAPTPPGSG